MEVRSNGAGFHVPPLATIREAKLHLDEHILDVALHHLVPQQLGGISQQGVSSVGCAYLIWLRGSLDTINVFTLRK